MSGEAYWREIADQRSQQQTSGTSEATLVSKLYNAMLLDHSLISQLESKYYLETFLSSSVHLENNDKNSESVNDTKEYFMSILILWNEKLRVCSSSSASLLLSQLNQYHLENMLDHLLQWLSNHCSKLLLMVSSEENKSFTAFENVQIAQFLINCFQSLDVPVIRTHCLKMVGLSLWNHLKNENRLQVELQKNNAKLMKQWKRMKRKESASGDQYSCVLPHLINTLFHGLSAQGMSSSTEDLTIIIYCERVVELLIDLLSQISTRKYLLVLLEDWHMYAKCILSKLYTESGDKAFDRFRKLLQVLDCYLGFEVDEQSGVFMSESDLLDVHLKNIKQLQMICFQHYPKMKLFSVSNIASIETRDALESHLKQLEVEELRDLCERANLIGPKNQAGETESKELLIAVIVVKYAKKSEGNTFSISHSPISPTEELIWSVKPTDHPLLCAPKVNLQFLHMSDYLSRYFELYRMDLALYIRKQLEPVLLSIKESNDDKKQSNHTAHYLWLEQCTMKKVFPPIVGDLYPQTVEATLLATGNSNRSGWSSWKSVNSGDILVLVNLDFSSKYGVKNLRVCELVKRDYFAKNSQYKLTVQLDPIQHAFDKETKVDYSDFNLLIRIPSNEYYSSLLDSIKHIQKNLKAPSWVRELILGYGDNFNYPVTSQLDTHYVIHSSQQLEELYPEYSIEYDKPDATLRTPPFRLQFPTDGAPDEDEAMEVSPTLRVSCYDPSYKDKLLFSNTSLTNQQCNAILSALRNSVTLVDGPSRTGKKEVTAQIATHLHSNDEKQKVLIVTKSEKVLNAIMDRIVDLGTNPSYVLNLGYQTTDKYDLHQLGRVNFLLQLRLDLLRQLDYLATSLNMAHFNVSTSCQTAIHFFSSKVLPLWNTFKKEYATSQDDEFVKNKFPFSSFFNPTFEGKRENDMRTATELFQYLTTIYEALPECRAFEVIRSHQERIVHLIRSHSKVIGVTIEQLTKRRQELSNAGLKYDNIIIGDADLLMDVETTIPSLLSMSSSLKRMIIVGDSTRNVPTNHFRSYSHISQSLFARLLRLGSLDPIRLDVQFDTNPDITTILSREDRPLQNISSEITHNPGIKYPYQFIQVDEFRGVGDSQVRPGIYQNLGEAEYIVAMYMYMRLIGHPKDSITILATTQAQVHLINDVLNYRCKTIPIFGLPREVRTTFSWTSTNDFVLLSLVRTDIDSNTQFIRNQNHILYAISSSKRGFYMFGNEHFLSKCLELAPIYRMLTSSGERSSKLHLIPSEKTGTTRTDDSEVKQITSVEELGQLVHQMTQTAIVELSKQYLTGETLPADDQTKEEAETTSMSDDEDDDNDSVHDSDSDKEHDTFDSNVVTTQIPPEEETNTDNVMQDVEFE